MNYKKPMYYIAMTFIISVFGQIIINSGYQMVGESGVSQEVVNAIVGTIAVTFGYVVIAYFIFKTVSVCLIEMVKTHET